MFKAKIARKSGVTAPKASLSNNVPRDGDLSESDSSSEEETFQGTQAPSMTQKLKAVAASSDSDFSSDLEQASSAQGKNVTGKPQLPGISPILAKLSGKDTSTPLKGSMVTPSKNPPRPTQPMGSSDSDSDESEEAAPAAQGRSSESANAAVAQKRGSDESDSEYDAPWSFAKQAPAVLKGSGTQVSNSDSDLDGDDHDVNNSVPALALSQSGTKAKVPEASDSDSELDSDIEEANKSLLSQSQSQTKVQKSLDSDKDLDSGEEESESLLAPAVKPKLQSPKKASAPNASDSDSDLDSDEEESKNLLAPAVQPKLQSPKKGMAPSASDSDSDLDSDEEESKNLLAPAVQPKLQSPKKSAPVRRPSESDLESSSDDDDTKMPYMASKPKPASPVKATPIATPMEVDDSSDEEAMIREAMNQVNQTEERAKAKVILRKNVPAADSETDSDFQPKSAKGKKAREGTPKQPAPKEVGSFRSKATISESDEVSSDSEPEKLGPIRQNSSLTPGNKSIAAQAKIGMEHDPAESSASDGEEEDSGPITDNSPGLLYLEDLASNDEVWLVRCPVDAKHSDLIGRKLVLGGTSKFMLGDDEFESRTYKHADARSRLACLLRTKDVGGLLKVVSVPTAGQVTFTRKVKLPSIALPATTSSEGQMTALPVGLKTRHPLFGADFQQAITVRDKTEDRPQTKVAAAEPPKKDSKRRSVTFREKPSFESTQKSDQDSASEKEEEKEKVEESSEDSDISDNPAPKDLVAMMVNKALLDRKTTLKLASKKSATSGKSAKASKSAVNTSIDHLDEAGKKTPASQRKSLQLKNSLTTSMIEKHLEAVSSPADKSGVKNSKKKIDSPSDSLNSTTKQKSLVSTPISTHQTLSSFLDDFDPSVSVPKTSQAKVSKKKVNSKPERPAPMPENLASLLDDSELSVATQKTSHKKGKKSISNIETPSSEAKKVASILDNSDSSVTKSKSSHKKGSKKMEISSIEISSSESKKFANILDNSDSLISPLAKTKGAKSPLTSKKTANLNLSDSSVTKPITTYDNANQPSKAKKKSRKSDSSLGSTLLANFLSRSLNKTIKKSVENTSTDQDSHTESLASKSKADSLKMPTNTLDGSDTSAPKSKDYKKKDESLSDNSATKVRRKSRKSQTATSDNCLNSSTNESPLNKSKISNLNDSKTNTSVKESKKMEAKIDSLSSSSQPNVSADSSSLSSELKKPKEKKDKSKKQLQKSTEENITEKCADLEQEDLVAMLLQQAISSEETSAKELDERPLPKSVSRKSTEADSAVKKERIAIKAKRRVGKTNAKDNLVNQLMSQVTTKTKESMASKGASAKDVFRPVVEETEQQKLIAELMRRSVEGIKGKGGKKRRREDGEEGGQAVKKSKKLQLADDGPDTPTSSKIASKDKPPLKKYRQLTLTSTIPPGIAELSPVAAKAKSKIGSNLSYKVDDLKSPATTKEPAETKTPPSKEKKKRKRDSSVSDLEIGSKKHKPIVQSEMGSQDASFTSKFQSDGYAGPGSPLFQRPSPSLGASQSDIDVQFESQDSIGLVANLETNQFEIPVTKKVRKSAASRDKRKLDASIDFGDFGCGGNLVSSTQKQAPGLLPSNRSSQGSEDSLSKLECSRKAPSDANRESPFVFKAPILSKGGRKKGSTRGDESGFESDGSSSRKLGEVDGFESDVTLKIFRTQADPIAMARQRAKKHLKNIR